MTLWQHIKDMAGFGIIDWFLDGCDASWETQEKWWFFPATFVAMLLAVMFIATPVNIAWLLAQLCIWAYRLCRKLTRPLWEVLMVRAGWPHPYPKPEEGKRDE